MTLLGGQGYLAGRLPASLYRDVRASAFMQLFGVVDGYDYIGAVVVGVDPFRELRAAVDRAEHG